MTYPYYSGGYQPLQQQQYYQPPMADQLAQLRQQQFQPPPQAQPTPPPQQSMIWVNGEAEAMAYLVAPNSAAALWDSAAPVIYLKQADASGKPSIKTYDLVERSSRASQPPAAQGEEYVTRTEFNALAAKLEALTTIPREDAE